MQQGTDDRIALSIDQRIKQVNQINKQAKRQVNKQVEENKTEWGKEYLQ